MLKNWVADLLDSFFLFSDNPTTFIYLKLAEIRQNVVFKSGFCF